MIERSALIDLITQYAIAYLNHDDAFPDVGWGMSMSTAIELADQDVMKEATRWNSLAAMALDFNDIRADVLDKVKLRKR